MPRKVSNGNISVALAPGFTISIAHGETKTLAAVVARYNRLVLLHGPPLAPTGNGNGNGDALPLLAGCSVSVASTTEVLSLGMDEGYELSVDGSSCGVTAATFAGALYGLEALSQLVLSDGAAATATATATALS